MEWLIISFVLKSRFLKKMCFFVQKTNNEMELIHALVN